MTNKSRTKVCSIHSGVVPGTMRVWCLHIMPSFVLHHLHTHKPAHPNLCRATPFRIKEACHDKEISNQSLQHPSWSRARYHACLVFAKNAFNCPASLKHIQASQPKFVPCWACQDQKVCHDEEISRQSLQHPSWSHAWYHRMFGVCKQSLI